MKRPRPSNREISERTTAGKKVHRMRVGKGYSALRDGYCAVTYLQGIPSFGWLSGWGAPTSPGLLSFVYFSFTALPLIDLSAYDPSLTTTRLPSLARKEKQRSRPRDPHLESASALKRSTISPPSRSSTASTTIKRPPRATTAKKKKNSPTNSSNDQPGLADL